MAEALGQSLSKTKLPVNKPFAEWVMADALNVIKSQVEHGPSEEGYQANRAFVVERDHWQKGKTWVGPRGTPETEQIVLDAVEPQFTPVDTLNEGLDTLADALLERRPAEGFVLRTPLSPDLSPEDRQRREKAAKDKSELVVRQLRQWAEKRNLRQLMRWMVKRSAWATWATIRAWVPQAKLTRVETLPPDAEEGAKPVVSFDFPPGLTLEEALDKVFLSAPEPECCLVYEDPETRERVAIFDYTFDDIQYVELWWVDATGVTNVRTLAQNKDAVDQMVELGGRLPFAQMDAELLVTESVRRQQARQNFFESLLVRVGETAGFPERYTLNAKPTGIWLNTPPSDGPALEVVEQDSQTWYLHPSPRTLGSAITTDLYGVQDQDEQGNKKTATPGVVFKDPTDPDYAIKAAKHAKTTIRQEMKQGHIDMDGEATSTGWSRVQARARFVSDVNNRRDPLARALAELFEAVLAFAANMTTELDGFLDDFRCVVTVFVSPGPIAPEERTAINEQVTAGLLAVETALVLLGIEDVTAELERIANQPDAKLVRLTKLAEVLTALTGAGLQLLTAAKLAQVTPEELALIQADAALTPTLEDEETQDDPADRNADPDVIPLRRPPAEASIDLTQVLAAIKQLQTQMTALAAAEPAPAPAPPATNITLPAINLTLITPAGERRIQVLKKEDGSFEGSVTPLPEPEKESA